MAMNSAKTKKNMSLKTKLMLSTLIILTVTFVVIIVISGFTAVSGLIKEKRENYGNAVLSGANKLNGWFDSQIRTMEMLELSVKQERVDTCNFENATSILKFYCDVDSDIYAIYIGRPDGSAMFSDGWDAEAENYDPTTRDWYVNACKTDGVYISSPYVDADTKKIVVTFSKALKDESDALTSVLAYDVFLDSIVNIAKECSPDEIGYPVISDSDSNIVVHKNADFCPSVDENEDEVVHSLNETGIVLNKDSFINEKADYNGVSSVFIDYDIGKTNWKYIYITPSDSFYRDVTNIIIIYLVVLLAFLIVDAFVLMLVIRKNLKPLSELKKASDSMLAGELSYKSEYRRNDEIGQVCLAIEQANDKIFSYITDIDNKLSNMSSGRFNNVIELEYIGDFKNIKSSMLNIQTSLKQTLSRINVASEQVASGSDYLASGSQELSIGATMQANAVDDLSSAFSNLENKMNISVNNAHEADSIVSDIGRKADRCNSSMNSLSVAMERIGTTSEEIKKITKTVEDIAFKTNLLSLNAAVEAARAGEQGKGFAVVADEVRNLATKSAEAAQLTARLVNESVEAIEEGTSLTRNTAEELNSLVQDTKNASVFVRTISDNAEEEKQEIRNMQSTVEKISNVVMNNTATAQQSAASSEELNSQATMLKSMIDEFEL